MFGNSERSSNLKSESLDLNLDHASRFHRDPEINTDSSLKAYVDLLWFVFTIEKEPSDLENDYELVDSGAEIQNCLNLRQNLDGLM